MALVSGNDGIGRTKLHFVERQIFPAFGDHGFDGDFRRRTHRPAFHDRMRVDDLRAQQFHRAQIVQRLGIDLHRRKSLAGIFIDDQRAILQRNGAEEARHRIAHGIDLSARDFQPVDVGNAGVIGSRIKIAPIGRKHAAFRYRAAQGHRGDFVDIAVEQIGDAVDADALVAIDLAHRCRKQRAVRRNIQVEQAVPIGKSDDLVPAIARGAGSHQRIQAVQVAYAPDGMIGRIERKIAHAAVADKHLGVAGCDIDLHQVAKRIIVRRVIDRARLGVVGERSDLVELRPLDVDEAALLAVLHRQCAHMGKRPRIPERADQALRFGVVIGARNRTECVFGQPFHGRRGIFAHQREIGVLKAVLPHDPVLPGFGQRFAEHALELGCVIAVAVLAALEPGDHLLGRIGQREIAEEARAIEIIVGADLEVDRIAFRLQAERIVEFRVVAHHGAEHHLVISALRAAQAAAHPCLHEHRAAFEIPARNIGARCGEVVVENGFGMIGGRQRLAVKEAAPPRILIVVHIHRGDVDKLVVHQCEKAFAGRERLECHADGGDIHEQRVVGRCPHHRLPVIGEVSQLNAGFVPWRPVEGAALEIE